MADQPSQTAPSSVLTLFDATIKAFDQGQAASTQEGMSLLADWFSLVNDNTETKELMQPMQALQNELQSSAPSNTTLGELLNQLAELTEAKAGQADSELQSRLKTLATALRNFAGQLSTVV